MDREAAWTLVLERVKNKNLRKHCLATEAVMRRLAERLGHDGETWALAGLLHDLDYDETESDFPRHGYETVKILAPHNLPGEVLDAILAHTGHEPCRTGMDRALYACDPVTGLIVAAALMHPDKKLISIDTDFVLRRFKEKRFAAGANREQIQTCDSLGLGLEEFLGLSLEAMQGISEELGL
jgi:uncharacterized protein